MMMARLESGLGSSTDINYNGGGGGGEFEYNNAAAAVLLVNPNDLQPEVAQIINTLRGDSVRHLLLVQIPLHPYPTFSLEKAVCNHGFFMMAPNKWDPPTKTLARPLRLAAHDESSSSVIVLIRHSLQNNNVLQLYIDNTHQLARPPNLTAITDQVKRMLRISPADETVSTEFQKLYPAAAARGFGRLFRSPTLFEDIVKCLLLSNCGWGRSLALAEALCELQFGTTNSLKNFPNSKELAQLDVQNLKLCKLGYRAEILSSIVHKVLKGRLQLDTVACHHHPTSQHLSLIDELLKISGIGSFVAANVSMCLGVYSTVPIDTETYRHLRKVHGIKNPTERTIKDMYHKYAPYDSLAYWFEHHMFYECEFGNLSELPPSSYHLVTSSPGDHDKGESKVPVPKSARESKKIVKKKKKKKKKGRRDKKSRKLLFTM